MCVTSGMCVWQHDYVFEVTTSTRCILEAIQSRACVMFSGQQTTHHLRLISFSSHSRKAPYLYAVFESRFLNESYRRYFAF